MVRFLHRMKSNRKAQSKNQKPRRKDFSKKLQNFFKSDYILDFMFFPQKMENSPKFHISFSKAAVFRQCKIKRLYRGAV